MRLTWFQLGVPENNTAASAHSVSWSSASGWWPLPHLLISICTGLEQSGKQEGQEKDMRAKKIDPCGRSSFWCPSRVRLQLSACLACLFGPERAGTHCSYSEWYKTERKALWWPLYQLLIRPVLSCDDYGRTRRPKKERGRKESGSVKIPLYVKLPVWEMFQISEFVSQNSVDKEFVWDLWVLYLFKSLCAWALARRSQACSAAVSLCSWLRRFCHLCVTSHHIGGYPGPCATVLRHG